MYFGNSLINPAPIVSTIAKKTVTPIVNTKIAILKCVGLQKQELQAILTS